MKTVKLTKKELDFIISACYALDGIYWEYANGTSKELKDRTGMTHKQMDDMVKELLNKIR